MEHEYRTKRNHSEVTTFLILGFSEFPELQLPLFALFSLLYLMALLGNLLVICLICTNQRLHIPMYFFLANLSALDVSSMTVTVPKLLAILLTQNNIVSFAECITQLYCYMACMGIEFILLATMAYDHYVAICNPLRYTMIMKKRVCALLASTSWVFGLLETLPHIIVTAQFSYCDTNVVDHFFCEFSALLKLSCTDTTVIDIMNYVVGVFTSFTPLLLTLTSYVFIISTILKIRSTEGKSKAFSTCSSHLTVIILLYGTLFGVYLQPSSGGSGKSNKLPTAIYIVTLPLLNPLIYSLRSKELNGALKKVLTAKSILLGNKHFM